jgi:hypothetical protein
MTAGERQGGIVTGSEIWTRAYPRQAVVFVLVVAVGSATLALLLCFGGDATSGYAALSIIVPLLWVLALWFDRTARYAMRIQRALGRHPSAVVAVGHESKVPQEVSTNGLGSASLYVRARLPRFRDCGLGAELVVPMWGGLCV